MAINPLAIGGVVVGAAAVVGGGLYAGGVFTSGSSVEQRGEKPNAEPEMPGWRSLNEDEGFYTATDKATVNAPYKDKYGDTYGRFLVGVTVANNKDDTNDKWWQWAYDNIYKNAQGITDKFSTVNKAVEGGKSLKNICKDSYGQDKTSGSGNIVTSKESITAEKYLEDNIWLFCSPAKTKIKTIEEAGKGSDYGTETGDDRKYGNKYKGKLVGTEGNDLFWEERLKDLKKQTQNPATTNSSFHIADHKTMTLNDLKSKCETAYKQKEDATTYPKADVSKFCSLSGKELTE